MQLYRYKVAQIDMQNLQIYKANEERLPQTDTEWASKAAKRSGRNKFRSGAQPQKNSVIKGA
jgi:hypothetical protein